MDRSSDYFLIVISLATICDSIKMGNENYLYFIVLIISVLGIRVTKSLKLRILAESLLLLTSLCFSHRTHTFQAIASLTFAKAWDKNSIAVVVLACSSTFRAIVFFDLFAIAEVLATSVFLIYVSPSSTRPDQNLTPLSEKKSERQEAETSWEDLLDLLPHGIAIKELDSNLWEYRNSAMDAIFEINDSEDANKLMDKLKAKLDSSGNPRIISIPFSEKLVSKENLANEIDSSRLHQLKESNARELETIFTIEDMGTKKYVELSTKIISWKKSKAILMMVKDRSDSKQVEKLSEMNALKKQNYSFSFS
eukprot:TRINITY_DN4816_c0_g1_i1.p1 TRINITY_DN4816_c0_g1~~TRINITY_DN4816_c0_g1_i1.p1  ORF type:complete len:308 (+),score=38.31 TRINITY_DN4816_c0_g1_i1:205-1128(+)